MALQKCAECQHEVSDRAVACPNCGMPVRGAAAASAARRRTLAIAAAIVVVALGGGVALAMALRPSDYSRVEQLRAEQDADGTHEEHVRQRFFRLYKAHPRNAMYIYLWSRCVDDPAEQLKLAEEGIGIDPRFSWNYNMAARALARQGRVADAYDEALKGAALDPGNMELSEKQTSLKTILDHKLTDEPKPAPSADKTVRYLGLFRSLIKSPERADLQTVEASRLPDAKAPLADALRGFVVCANPYADACVRVFVPRDARFKSVWPPPATDVTTIKEHQLVSITGSVVANTRGDSLILADALAVEAP